MFRGSKPVVTSNESIRKQRFGYDWLLRELVFLLVFRGDGGWRGRRLVNYQIMPHNAFVMHKVYRDVGLILHTLV